MSLCWEAGIARVHAAELENLDDICRSMLKPGRTRFRSKVSKLGSAHFRLRRRVFLF